MTSTISQQISEFIGLRHGLGYRVGSIQDRYLVAFGRWLEAHGHQDGPIALSVSVQWALETTAADPHNPARRLTMVRGFLRHLSGLDGGATEVPPTGLLGPTLNRRPPHVYSDAEIADLLAAAAGLSGRLRPHCYVALFGLLACSGMRVGETVVLSCGDVDLPEGVITVRRGKRDRARLVPLHRSAVSPLADYANRRAGCYGNPTAEDAFFRTDRADHVSYPAAATTFRRIRDRLGWDDRGRARTPRLHDLRHRMVVRRLQAWYAAGVDVDRKMPVLATYLGHTDVSSLYWYLSAVPELMSIIAARFNAYAGSPRDGKP